jgi:hypothetical protein
VPLAVSLTGAHRNDVTQLLPLLDAIPRVRGRPGRPRHRPNQIYGDRGYDHDRYRHRVRLRGIRPVIARRGTPHGSGLGTYRWVVEQTVALLHWFRRLRIRWEIRDDIHEAFMTLACAIICYRRLKGSFRACLRSGHETYSMVPRPGRVAGRPRAMRRTIVLMAAQRIIASELAGSRS